MLRLFYTILFFIIFAFYSEIVEAQTTGKVEWKKHPIYALVDIAHEFTFYFDGRFGNAYLSPIEGKDARLWATLSTADLENFNLLIIPQGATPCPYTQADIRLVTKFVKEEGGGLFLIGNYGVPKGERDFMLNRLTEALGIKFLGEKTKGKLKLSVNPIVKDDIEIEGRASGILQWKKTEQWIPLIVDENNKAVAAIREFGKGRVAVVHGSGLFGDKPKEGEAINARWICPLLKWLSENKKIDPDKPLLGKPPEREKRVRGLIVQFSSYLERYADEIVELYFRVAKEMEEIMGVPLAEGMNTTLILLPTGGGGFSSGVALGIGVWWGGFPEERYPMIELIAHEATHSWVLPFPEPLWNEGIATYIGIEIGKRLGYVEEGERSRQGWAEACERLDPAYRSVDISQPEPPGLHDVYMGKPMWIWDRLREKYGDGIIARYFRTKRKFIEEGKLKEYTAHDCVAVLSIAVGEDLFPWFQSLGINVSKEKTTLSDWSL